MRLLIVIVLLTACTFPTKIAALRATSPVENLCIASLRVLAIFAWIARTRPFLRARWAIPSAPSYRRYRPDASSSPSEHVAAVFRPRSIPTRPVPADFGTSTLTHTFRYHLPRASCENDPARRSNRLRP